MLERMKPEGGDGGCIGMIVDTEYAAFLAEPISVEVEIEFCHGLNRAAWPPREITAGYMR